MAQLTPQDESTLSGAPSFQNCDPSGDRVRNDGTVALWIKNNSAGGILVTVHEGRTCDFGHAHVNHSFTVGAGQTWKTPTYEPSRWNEMTGDLFVTYASTSSLQIAAVSQKTKYRG